MLTRREVEIIHGAALGLSNDEIGERLWLSGHTVKTHFSRIYTKIGMGDRAGLVAIAFRKGWIVWEGAELIMKPPLFVKQGRTKLAIDAEPVRV